MIPEISIVIPLYNKANAIKKTMASAITQTFINFEIIVINDGSTDDSLEVVESLNDKRIRIYTTKNQGVSAARNYGINKANSDYIAFLDADDLWLPNHLENLYSLRKKFPSCGMYCTAYEKHYNTIVSPAVFNEIPNDKNWKGILKNYFKSSIKNPIAWTSATMVPKTVLKEINGFDESITLGAGEDTDLWIRIALKYPIAFCNSVTAIHNLIAENRISNSKTSLRQFIDLDIYEPYTKDKPYLKIYLDVNRFAIGMQYKISGDKDKAFYYFSRIDKESLNKKQRFLISRSTWTLRFIKGIQSFFRKNKIDLTPFH